MKGIRCIKCGKTCLTGLCGSCWNEHADRTLRDADKLLSNYEERDNKKTKV
jgi:hypothetical protein